MKRKNTSTKTRAAAATTEEVCTVRLTGDLRELRVRDRIKALASSAAMQEAVILRSLLMVALPLLEKDPSLIVRAPALCRGEG